MVGQKNNIGILWIGGKSRRYKHSSRKTDSQFSGNKIFSLLLNKPLFLWSFNTLHSVVDQCILSFNSFEQYELFRKFIGQTSFSIPHFDQIIDSPSISLKGPLQAQLTVLNELNFASKILTVSADMPFVSAGLLNLLLAESSAISTLQSPNKILEPLISSYRPKKIHFAMNFLSALNVGRADDLHRGVETLTIFTVPINFPSSKTPWNLNINYKDDLDNLNSQNSIMRNREMTLSQRPLKYDKTIIVNPGNKLSTLTGIFSRNLELQQKGNESDPIIIYNELMETRSYFIGGKYAEYIAHHSKETQRTSNWYLKAVTSYWKETEFWVRKKILFLAIHSLKDCHQCMRKTDHQISINNEANRLLQKLQKQLNLAKG